MKSYFFAENLRQSFESIDIDISLSAEKNTMTSIVGPSGSGKSTLLRLIAGLEKGKTDSGKKIVLDGEDITDKAPAKRGIGMVFQNHALFEHMTVADNVAYGLISRGMKKKEARKLAGEFLTEFGLEGFEKRMPSTLSGGEAQRVSLARSLIIKPKLVLFDEPLSSLDAPLRYRLSVLIRELQKKFGFTGIMVTHDIEEAKRISDKIILIKQGKLTWQGAPEDFSEEMI